ncbi:PP2C family protein-serine/threonine phosphatase [Actinopolymorpha singaporensis]|uniref:Protein phosphatase n=1 Tax=Actinopolymorpha singaporensis TaxID=117157 RepID=A0A1H1NAG8_9ACTN|nr:protein phosphatase 2C domain-containing protein [Actinopolymorpha singaporensis]SDR95840.1 protein phosphatase [Actinopolymorpha singaporensis]
MTLALRYAARTDVGLGPKKRNEDSGYAGPYLLAVADGMGGAVGGDVASAITITTVRDLDVAEHADPDQELNRVAAEANSRIAARIETEPHLEGMGTTLTAILFDGSVAHVAHIGDSRAYLLRGGRLRMLTHDHTFVQSLVDEGRITPEEAEYHPHRSLIIRVLEGRQDARPDIQPIEVDPGDRFLVCSDGLDNAGIKDPVIAEILGRAATPEEAATNLVEAALDHGSPDNVTCVVADVVDPDRDGGPGAAASAIALVGAVAAVDPEVSSGGNSVTSSHPTSTHEVVDEDDDPDEADVRVDDVGAGVPGDADREEELRYAPRPPRRRFRWLVRVLCILAVLALLAVGVRWAYDWTQRQYYVGAYPADAADNGGAASGARVAIFRGISQQIPGLRVSQLYELEPLTLAKLPQYHRERVSSTISATDLGEARAIVSMLSDVARRCSAQGTTKPTPTPTPRPTGKATGRPSPTKTPNANAALPSPSPTDSPAVSTGNRAAGAPDIPLECDGGEAPTPTPTGTK